MPAVGEVDHVLAMNADGQQREIVFVQAQRDHKSRQGLLDGLRDRPLILHALLVNRNGGDHSQEAEGLVADGAFDLVPELVATLEAAEVVPDGVARKLQTGAEPANEAVVLWRGVADEDGLATHLGIVSDAERMSASGRSGRSIVPRRPTAFSLLRTGAFFVRQPDICWAFSRAVELTVVPSSSLRLGLLTAWAL